MKSPLNLLEELLIYFCGKLIKKQASVFVTMTIFFPVKIIHHLMKYIKTIKKAYAVVMLDLHPS